MTRTRAMVIPWIAAAGLMVAGCSGTSSSAMARAAGRSAAVSPSSSAECFLLSGAQVQAVVGLPVGLATAVLSGVCVYQFPHGAGGVNFGVASFASAAQARGDLRQTVSSDAGPTGLKVASIRGLGQEAITVLGGQAAAAIVVIGPKELTVNISLPQATSQMAITLAREAIRRM
jgi:hypothetical protein